MRVIIDARGHGHHPVEMAANGHGWMLYQIGQTCHALGNETHVIMDGHLEMYENGVSYWPAERHPQVCDVVIGMGSPPRNDIRAKRAILGREVYQVMPVMWEAAPPVEKVKNRLVWTANPNRGLWNLMRIWPLVKAEVQDVSLVITHGLPKYIEAMRWQHDFQGLQALELAEWIKNEEITVLPYARRDEVQTAIVEAEIFAYPADPILPFPGHRSLSTVEAATNGCALLLSDAETLYEDFGEAAAFLPNPARYEDWAEVIVQWLKNDAERHAWQEKAKDWARQHTRQGFNKQWQMVLEN